MNNDNIKKNTAKRFTTVRKAHSSENQEDYLELIYELNFIIKALILLLYNLSKEKRAQENGPTFFFTVYASVIVLLIFNFLANENFIASIIEPLPNIHRPWTNYCCTRWYN